MRIFLLLSVACSMRLDGNQTQQVRLKAKAGKGEKCSCYSQDVAEQDCCGTGLLCSKSGHICKPALTFACNYRFVENFGVTQCAQGTYQSEMEDERDKPKIMCKPRPGAESFCCVKRGGVRATWLPDGKGDYSACCSGRGYTTWKSLEKMQFWEMAEDKPETHVCYED